MTIKKIGMVYVVWHSIMGKPFTAYGNTSNAARHNMNEIIVKHLTK